MSALLTWIAHGSVLVALVSLGMGRGRGPNAATRYLLWWAAMAALLALPVAHALASPTGFAAAQAEGVSALESAVPTAAPLLILPHQLAAVAPWLIASVGALVLWRLFALTQAAVRLRRVRASCLPLPDGLEASLPLWRAARDGARPVRLLATLDLQTPSVLGVPPGDRGLPIIALPLWTIESLDAESLDLIVLHELAHIERGDDRDLLVQAAIAAAFCWHPAVWWVGRRLNEERERACDDEVVRRTDRAAQYARCLVGVAARVGPGPVLLAAPGIGRPGRRLTRRVERLLAAPVPRQGPRARVLRLAQVTVTLAGLATAVVVSAAGAPRVHLPEPNWDSMRTASMTSFAPAASIRLSAGSTRGYQHPQPVAFAPQAAVPPPRAAGRAPAGRVDETRPAAATLPLDPPSLPHPLAAPASSPAPAESSDAAPSIAEGVRPVASFVDLVLSAPALSAPRSPVESSPNPWKRPADAGHLIGRGAAQAGESIGKASAQAGVKTAGFFSRMGRAVASSF